MPKGKENGTSAGEESKMDKSPKVMFSAVGCDGFMCITVQSHFYLPVLSNKLHNLLFL